jgi:hypothetical protein
MPRNVTLEKPQPDDPDFSRYGRGERRIMVDGEQWGRTHVRYHGGSGQSHNFEQEGGEILLKNPEAKYPREISVSSDVRGKHHYGRGPRSDTFETVRAKAQELVETGRLRDPAIVRAERQTAQAKLADAERAAAAAEEQAFREKARKALAGLQLLEGEKAVDRVVAAMRWAQSQ